MAIFIVTRLMVLSVGLVWWAKAFLSHPYGTCMFRATWSTCLLHLELDGFTPGVEVCDGVTVSGAFKNLKKASRALALSEYFTVSSLLCSAKICSSTPSREVTNWASSYSANSAISSKSLSTFFLEHEKHSVSKTVISIDNPRPSLCKELSRGCKCKHWGSSRLHSTLFSFVPF